MGFITTPTRPLAKIYTLKMVVNTAIQKVREETQRGNLEPEFVKTLANLSIMDIAEFISGEGSDDYGKTAIVSDAGSSTTISEVSSGVTFTISTKTITKTAHGLTSTHIGRRIAYGEGNTTQVENVTISEIVSITDANNFVVAHAAGDDLPNQGTYAWYAVFSAHTSTNIDLSSYKIANITKLVDSINGEVKKVGDIEFDNLGRFDERQNQSCFFKHGEYLFLYKGSVASFGTLTLYYNSYPQLFTDEDSLVDIKDNYVPLVIADLVNRCLETLGIKPSGSLSELIAGKKKDIRERILKEKAVIDEKNKEKSIN